MNKPRYRHYPSTSKQILLQTVFWLVLAFLALIFSMLIYFSYQDYTHPKHVYGSWIEIGTPPHLTEVLTFNEQGVFRNERLISTQFGFDGRSIEVTTGSGITIYQLSGTQKSPQLRRIEPLIPHQRFIREGYEHTISTDPTPTRRSAVSEHFREQ
ncbi:DUF2850 domain-containing protein [Vibrio sp. V27_P1S3P104]|uniref:DUF2850 domain-containing protein n=1 Tax=Vibrio TaxID=662 RepID=UPI000C16C636|nr:MULTISPECIES: DUF2850 domain-containing protein [Vibrio]NAW68804.1 DUF2850 domain-containing protein [Vibrio sp. V28_P6S34P95]NAX35637.1 DUF2850 domain-containing protein [Vibrio sp. V29_P1S30P107]NAX38286.1 DUF2850 domain-containing protein [Vibrio sp. V27_P1S3P104]NAX39968.1 DUF2850 domain-containing protein [Vibrio sp. V26_P1S5P106]NNN44976.1 DUF2850 domain-containing protein [Vibrio sp. 1-1(7)]